MASKLMDLTLIKQKPNKLSICSNINLNKRKIIASLYKTNLILNNSILPFKISLILLEITHKMIEKLLVIHYKPNYQKISK